MRKVILAINMSIDGCVGHMSLPAPDEEVGGYFNDLMNQDVDLIAYGRKMYEIMFPYWADEANWGDELDTEFGQRLTAIDKIVFSRTLDSAEYNTRIVSTDPVEELLKLKQAPGKNIYVGTVSMIPQLAQAGVIDEYHFFVAPVITGQGPRLVEDGTLAEKLNLEHVATKTFKSGVIALHYKKRA
ncbi:dihydrofolate reductase family protein [Mucilaginibacter sp. BJC16-A38]|uniref:dihydrofolate reductase family protein n=1 Tax=Mucilaginibacter phenanthrenivorans TaxID=1234842 RepID=UPI002157D77E|nr:dihydrofolate reductase family protein [Mucilaginibacter phenanthrenivorans]MCR8556376.1 dihydrofolate reductase family protein [Mucilaginibacter phenanthrenivorans]